MHKQQEQQALWCQMSDTDLQLIALAALPRYYCITPARYCLHEFGKADDRRVVAGSQCSGWLTYSCLLVTET